MLAFFFFLHHACVNIVNLGLTENIYLAVCVWQLQKNILRLECQPFSCQGLDELPVWVSSSGFSFLPTSKSHSFVGLFQNTPDTDQAPSSGTGKLISALRGRAGLL